MYSKIIFSVFLIVININILHAQKVKVIKLPELRQKYLRDNDTLYIINFWATWCRPCVEELPGFQKLNESYKDKKIKMILVSLDFKKELNKLETFIITKKIKPEVVLLDETNYNSWIDQIDPSWGGAIPATLFVNNKENIRLFHEKSITFDELEAIVKPNIKN
jgi:thiol-disulfide isomerase/thioredoxin